MIAFAPGRPSALGRRYRAILRHTGGVSVVAGVVIASPALAVVAYPAELSTLPVYVVSGAALVLLGAWMRRSGGPSAREEPMGLGEGSVVVVLSWALAVIFAAVPFVLVGGLDVTGAVFESTSGWTTTGLSVVDVTSAPRTLLVLRSVLQLAGGAGLAILMLSALVGPAGIGIATAEGKEDLLVPVVDRSSRLVVRIYAGYALIGTVALRLAGMSWFDAVNHAATAVSTGGFSTRPESIGAWDSPAIELTVIVLMVLGNLSFVTAWAALRGRWRTVWTNGEVRVSSLAVVVGGAVVWLGAAHVLFPSVAKASRVALFETVTALTTTGFSTVSYTDWPALGWFVLIALMIVGGGTCSTAGGIKQHRVYVLWRYLCRDMTRRLGPRRAVSEPFLREGSERRFLAEVEVARIGAFVFLYLAALGAGTAVLAAYGNALPQSLFEFASALGTVGLSVGVTGPAAPHGVLWAETAGMALGRLEFFTVFVGAARLLRDGRLALRAARTSAPGDLAPVTEPRAARHHGASASRGAGVPRGA
jgi:trk system potassium uptake protein TrkH